MPPRATVGSSSAGKFGDGERQVGLVSVLWSFERRHHRQRSCSPAHAEAFRRVRHATLYGHPHRRDRKRWSPIVAEGRTRFPRCGLVILRGQQWQLDHLESGVTHPSHRSCNARAGHAAGALSGAGKRKTRLELEWRRTHRAVPIRRGGVCRLVGGVGRPSVAAPDADPAVRQEGSLSAGLCSEMTACCPAGLQ